MSLKQPLAATLYLLSGTFIALAALFIMRPEQAAAVFGLESRDSASLFYVRAIGFRDLALAAYIVGLSLAGERRALFIVLIGTLVIPVSDMMLLAWSGAGASVCYVLHGASLLCFAGLALWVSRVRSTL